MLSVVSARGELHFAIQQEEINDEAFLTFAKDLINDAGRPVFLIMDNGTVHHAKIIREYAEQSKGMLRLYFLPPYSPDFNLDEWVWKNVKHSNLGRASAKGEGELMQFARAALSRLKEAPEDTIILRRLCLEICPWLRIPESRNAISS